MNIARRGWIRTTAGTATLMIVASVIAWSPLALHSSAHAWETDAESPKRLPGQLGSDEIQNMLEAMGLNVEVEDRRFDFKFKAKYDGEEWTLSMSVVLSENERSIWVMAWLDQIPASAADVPRTALLRLLAANDRMGKGKFFAYIPTNKRLVLQRVIPNYKINSRAFRAVMVDLGASVVETFQHWSVANWKRKPETEGTAGDPGTVPPRPRRTGAVQTSSSETRFTDRRVQ